MTSASESDSEKNVLTLPLHAEEISISKRKLAGDTVRVSVVTREHEHVVDETLAHEVVEIERVPINRPIDAPPPIREEGDTTIMPVVEEIIVVERRLILKEEIHIRRTRVDKQHRETMMVRDQQALITRSPPDAARAPPLEKDALNPSEETARTRERAIVAVHDANAGAEAARRDLQAAPAPGARFVPATDVAGMGAAGGKGDAIQRAEERLTIGERSVMGDAARVRRHVVEMPVEEQVAPRQEEVTIECRPITDGHPVAAAGFTDKTIEMTESREEAVVSRAVRVMEEVALRKEAIERVGTVRDTVRREEVAIERLPGEPAADAMRTAPGEPAPPSSRDTKI